ncbi:CDP-diacylglycerol--serine O-phosphatidyltransferase [Luteimonas huabeiensis]|uniref:CDP-diacylglycerol--serine O-phosphatidyltransferase n=1 Tax=Luteimonas huabeiensis TaxID=1244513 RepID=UPI0004636237|nr:CDP-diacylglycerol--serine O-phosphatidyltransferase [Luteimonas huabeiensis]
MDRDAPERDDTQQGTTGRAPPPPAAPRLRGRGIYLLPNLFTTGGLFAGFFAIIAASQGRFGAACVAIFVAAVLDGIDGRVARLTNTQSEFGVQYDSLADLISFGMAPALVMYHWSLVALRLDGPTLGKIGWLAAFLYAACAALRLARFNSQVDVVDKRWFIGLASPAAAGLMASFVWTCDELGLRGADLRYAALAVTVVAGLAMVSRIRYTSFKGSGTGPRSDRVPFVALPIAVAVLIALWIDPPRTLLAASALYLLSGPAQWIWRRRARQRAA